ncbi:hypothetical protein LTR22_010488 [Elasticomyces elasticus]|nr:hypothetical protein LTR22_010488 [Elasticomyces elasticus]
MGGERYDDAFLAKLEPGHRNSILRRRRNHELRRKRATAGNADALRDRERSSESTAMEADANDRSVQLQGRRPSTIEMPDSNEDYTPDSVLVKTKKHFKLRPLVRRDYVEATVNENEHPTHTPSLQAQLSRTQHDPHMPKQEAIAELQDIVDLCSSDDDASPVMKAETRHERAAASTTQSPAGATSSVHVDRSARQAGVVGSRTKQMLSVSPAEIRLLIQAKQVAQEKCQHREEELELERQLLRAEAELG